MSNAFRDYIQSQARDLRQADQPATTLADWQQQREQLRQKMIASWGGFPSEHCPLEPQLVGTLERDGYTVEKLLIQTRPGIWMPANAYVPAGGGKRPAVLCVHGHWKFAKQHPDVQSRCIGLVKLGFFVLMVDAFGAGERGLGKDLGEYHGEMVAATLFPTGLALAGMQVYENMRAIDYIQSRPEVDPTKIGVTGASGGGNQTMYIGAMDDRLGAVVPVCSVGRYQAYLGAACCMCEVTPGALSYTEEGAVLGLVAPRALMVINATQDAFQFSVGQAEQSIAFANNIFNLYQVDGKLQHTVFESPHAYNQPMREAMYGWMTRHLKGEGDGSPIPEPAHTPEDPETLRCYPGQSRPDDYITLTKFAGAEGRRLTAKHVRPNHVQQWQAQEMNLCMGLSQKLGPFPARGELQAQWNEAANGVQQLVFQPEPGVQLTAHVRTVEGAQRQAILLDCDNGTAALDSPLGLELVKQNWNVVALELRSTGTQKYPGDVIGRAPDHNSAEWSLWLGRPLLSQWVFDVSRLLDVLQDKGGKLPTVAIGIGPAGLVALCAGSLTTRIHSVAMLGTLATYVTDRPYEGQRLGTLVPGLLRDVGDIPQIAATISPRRMVIAGAVTPQNEPLTGDSLTATFQYASKAYALEGAPQHLQVLESTTPADVVGKLSE